VLVLSSATLYNTPFEDGGANNTVPISSPFSLSVLRSASTCTSAMAWAHG
jgi:hypothetical protein